MEYMTAKEAALKWGITKRRIIKLCSSKRIEGSRMNGIIWNIPKNAAKPVDKRTKHSKYVREQKTIVIAGINSEIGKSLSNILIEEGYKIIGLYQKNSNIDAELNRQGITLMEVDYFNREDLLEVCNSIKDYLFGFVFMEIYFQMENNFNFDYEAFENSYKINLFAMNLLTRELVKKMNYESSIVIVNSIEAYRGSFGASAYASTQAAKANLVQTFANIFTEMYGVRINSIMAGWIGGVMESDDTFNKAKQAIPMKRLGNPEEIADDIFLMLTRHKYMTGSSLISDGGYLAVDEQSKTEDLSNGKYYKILEKFFNEAKPGTHIWAISVMLPVEWSEDPLEIKFRQQNADAINRGVKMDRIFVFDKKDTENYRGNPFLEMCLAEEGKSEATFVDRAIVEKESKELLTILGDGFIGMDEYVLLVDIPPFDDVRGYATFNKKEIAKAKRCFNEIKKYGIPLKDAFRRARR